jgi:SAM-dependent methyltransferase
LTQNLYDNPDFFEGYSKFERSICGLDGAPEWASLRAMLGDLSGSRAVDLGCGYGWFCRWARDQEAVSVLGIDISELMLARARELTIGAGIDYLLGDLESLDLPEASFDIAYSSLALHYVERLPALIETIYDSLVPGGRFIFSVEHPLLTAPSTPEWIVDPNGNKAWPVDSYLHEGSRTTEWITSGVVKQHRTFTTYLNVLIKQGFTVQHVEEWGPTDEQVKQRPSLAEERHRPSFLLISARR